MWQPDAEAMSLQLERYRLEAQIAAIDVLARGMSAKRLATQNPLARVRIELLDIERRDLYRELDRVKQQLNVLFWANRR